MTKFRIRYGLGGGFGGCGEWEEIECKDLKQANELAWESACEEYDSYGGMHGLRDVDSVMEEEECSYEDAEEIVREDMESWLEYEAEEIKE